VPRCASTGLNKTNVKLFGTARRQCRVRSWSLQVGACRPRKLPNHGGDSGFFQACGAGFDLQSFKRLFGPHDSC